jgi:hypothetical protein
MEEITVDNKLQNGVTIENEQNKFLETNIGKAVNTGVNIGLRYLLPDLIEDEIIDIKDSIINNGFKEGLKTAVDSAINLGKSALGLVTGKFENVSQMQTAVKSGGIIDSISDLANFAINKVVDSGKISYTIGNTIKQGKNVILNNITKNIENEFENQVNNMEKLDKYINNWKNYFGEKDFDGMQREYEKIKTKIKEIAPIENTIKTARTVENLHTLIKNNGKNFNLTEDEINLAKML